MKKILYKTSQTGWSGMQAQSRSWYRLRQRLVALHGSQRYGAKLAEQRRENLFTQRHDLRAFRAAGASTLSEHSGLL